MTVARNLLPRVMTVTAEGPNLRQCGEVWPRAAHHSDRIKDVPESSHPSPKPERPLPQAVPAGDPNRVISFALLEARRRGLDDVSQARYAVAAVKCVRPDFSDSDAQRSVEAVRRQAALLPSARWRTGVPE